MKINFSNKGAIYTLEALIILPILMIIWVFLVEVTHYLTFRNRCEQIVFTLGDLLPVDANNGTNEPADRITIDSISQANLAIKAMAGGLVYKDITHLAAVVMHRTDRPCWKDWKLLPTDTALDNTIPSGEEDFAPYFEDFLCAAFSVDRVIIFKDGTDTTPSYSLGNQTKAIIKDIAGDSNDSHEYNFRYTDIHNKSNSDGSNIRELTQSICGVQYLLPSIGPRCRGFDGNKTNISNPSYLQNQSSDLQHQADNYYANRKGSYYAPMSTPLVLTSYRPIIQNNQSFIIINMYAKYTPVFLKFLISNSADKTSEDLFQNVSFQKYFVSIPRIVVSNAETEPLKICLDSSDPESCY